MPHGDDRRQYTLGEVIAHQDSTGPFRSRMATATWSPGAIRTASQIAAERAQLASVHYWDTDIRYSC
jgi:hypothetical protein